MTLRLSILRLFGDNSISLDGIRRKFPHVGAKVMCSRLSRMVAAGELSKSDGGRYTVTDAGRLVLAEIDAEWVPVPAPSRPKAVVVKQGPTVARIRRAGRRAMTATVRQGELAGVVFYPVRFVNGRQRR